MRLARIPTWLLFAMTMSVGITAEFFPLLAAAIGWFLLLSWFVAIRGSLEGWPSLSARKVYLGLATIAAFYPSAIAVLVSILGKQASILWFERLIWLFAPIHTAAMAGFFYAGWTAARALVVAEPTHSAIRTERTVISFLQLLFWPIGIWFFHPRYQRVLENAT